MSSNLISKPIFLVGAQRSGTTVLRLMLAHHPQIAWCFEFEYAVELVSDSGEFPQVEAYLQWLETDRIFQSTNFQIDPSLNYSELVDSFLIQQRDREDKLIIGATVHHHFDRLLAIWPDARFIHLLRDGRDVARSCINIGWAGNAWMGIERWLEAEQLWNKVKAIIPENRYIEVTYETLIKDPVTTLTRICNFIDLSYDENMLSYFQTTTYDLPDPNFIQQWRNKMPETEIQLVESKVGTLLKERGYELSGLPFLKVTPLRKKMLRLQNWWFRLKFRIKRNGFNLVLSDFLARRLGFKQWQKQIKLKLNAIENTHLK